MADIFDLQENYPTAEDDHTETFKDLDGNVVALTIDRVVPMVSNAIAGHHPECGMPDCEMVETMQSQLARDMAQMMGQPEPKPEMMASCYRFGPTNPERNKRHEQAKPPFPTKVNPDKRVGFDIARQIGNDSADIYGVDDGNASR